MSRLPLRNPFALRIALSLVLTVSALWLAGCAMPPARPQTEPLPDNEVVQTRLGATSREEMIGIVLTGQDRWGRQVMHVGRDDTHYVVGSGFFGQPQGCWPASDGPMSAPSDGGSNTDIPLPKAIIELVAPAQVPHLRYPDDTSSKATAHDCMLAKCYWGIVGKTPTCQQLTTGSWAWSVVLISWIMCKAGLQNDQSLTGTTHARYVADARNHLFRCSVLVLKRTPTVSCPGGPICTARGASRPITDPAEIQADRMPMHYDLVVKMDPVCHEMKSVDGNVRQPTSMSITKLNDANQLDPHANSIIQWSVVLRNRLP